MIQSWSPAVAPIPVCTRCPSAESHSPPLLESKLACDLLQWIEGGQNDAGSVLGLALQQPDRFFFRCVGSWLPWDKSCYSTGEFAPASSPVGKWLAQDQLASWATPRSPGSLSSALSSCYHWSAVQSDCSSSHGWCNITHWDFDSLKTLRNLKPTNSI